MEMHAQHMITMVLLGTIASIALARPIEPLTIHEIQSNTSDGDASIYHDSRVDCVGGVVVGKFEGYRPRLILQDPNDPAGWGAIQAKDWTNGELFDNAEVGDWVALNNVLVEEFRGGTFLQWQAYAPDPPELIIMSQGNELPPPLLVSVTEIPAPIGDDYNGWYVENHDAELYESTRIYVRDVTVTETNLGKAVDNYNLQGADEDDCWAADYMNEDAGGPYHPFVEVGQHFCAVAGVFEQYTKVSDGWDYYQLVTKSSANLAICGDGDVDGDVDLDDLPHFQECFSGPRCNDEPGGCNPPAWTWSAMGLPVQHCLMMDLDFDGDVDLHDFSGFLEVFDGAP